MHYMDRQHALTLGIVDWGGWLSSLRRGAKLFRASAQWFYLGLIPGQGKIMNVQVFYHEVNMALWALFSNV